jgi:RNA polymerase-binding transcription factor DksA
MIDQALREDLHGQLLANRDRLQREIETLSGQELSASVFQEDETDSVDQHPADDASELFEREKNLSVLQTLDVSLQEVNAALRKVDQGTYGICERCGNPIPEKRLRALPEATHDVNCQAIIEREAQAGIR